MTLTLTAPDEQTTARIAAALADHLRPGDAVLLDGALAAGKTFFTRALVAALGSDDAVTSPTYAIANIYESPRGPVLHVDAYRLESAREFYHLGLEDYLETGIAVIEWGERVDTMFDAPLHLRIGFGADDNSRSLCFTADAPRWAPVLTALEGLA